jgi:hypothetical protein
MVAPTAPMPMSALIVDSSGATPVTACRSESPSSTMPTSR